MDDVWRGGHLEAGASDAHSQRRRRARPADADRRARITRGTYVGSGKKFEIVDGYHDPKNAHRILANAWIGSSEFRVMNIDSE